MFEYGQSYKTLQALAACDGAAAPKPVPTGRQFECKSGLLPSLPGQPGVQGYQIRSHGTDYYVAKAVADAGKDTYWQQLALAPVDRRNAQARISDWDVGEGVKNGGHATGFASKLKTTVKWGAPVPSVSVPDATWMEATIIGPDHALGSVPSGDGVKNAQDLTAATGVQWIGGHLLNHNLGGPGDDVRNIAAIPSKNTNTYHSSQIEEKIKDHIHLDGGLAYYRVDVAHENVEVQATANHPKGNFQIASKLETRWQKLDKDGLPIGNLNVDSFPIPKPAEIHGKSTANAADWHKQQPAEVPKQGVGTNGEARTGTFLGHPTSEPLTCKLDDYPNQGLAHAPSSFPNQRYLSPPALATFAEDVLMKISRGTPQALLVRTTTMMTTLDESAYKAGNKRNANDDGFPLEKKAAKQRPNGLDRTEKNSELWNDLKGRIIADVRANPDGGRGRLARGWLISLEIAKNSPAFQKDPSMNTDPCYREYTDFMASDSEDFTAWLAAQPPQPH